MLRQLASQEISYRDFTEQGHNIYFIIPNAFIRNTIGFDPLTNPFNNIEDLIFVPSGLQLPLQHLL